MLKKTRHAVRLLARGAGDPKRRRLLVVSSLAIVIMVAAGATALVGHAGQVRAAAEAAAMKHRTEIAEQRRAQAAADAEARLAQAHKDARGALDDGASAAKSSAAWADHDAVEALRSAMTNLSAAKKRDALAPLLSGIDEVQSSIVDLGTEDDALDRKYVAARIAAGASVVGDDETYAISNAQEYCATLTHEYGVDPQSAYPRYVGIAISEDLQAVQVYCPKFKQPSTTPHE